MKTLISTVSYLGLIAGLVGTAQAQSCKQVPSCASLGYTRAAGTCPEGVTVLTCPFDAGYIYCPEDCRLYPLTSAECDSVKGVCSQCGDSDHWKYDSCNTGWYKKDDMCEENECTSFPSASSSITGCSATSGCQKGETMMYKCSSCKNGYYADNNVCAENTCDGFNSASSSISNCASVNSCQKGETTMYACAQCAADYIYKNGYCVFATKSFDYTGSVQSVTLAPGTYKLEVWGASGGRCESSPYYGGYGAYASGLYTLTTETVVYIVVGGAGGHTSSCTIDNSSSSNTASAGYNGGGYGSGSRSGGGGGATHIATIDGVLSSLSSSQSDVLIVAGGGGGATSAGNATAKGKLSTDTSDSNSFGQGGNGRSGTYKSGYSANSSCTSSCSGSTCTDGDGTSYSCTYYRYTYDTHGGGGGWYGGSSYTADDPNYAYGGRNYISSVLSSISEYDGVTSMPAPGGGTENGHSGNGYARITLQE